MRRRWDPNDKNVHGHVVCMCPQICLNELEKNVMKENVAFIALFDVWRAALEKDECAFV